MILSRLLCLPSPPNLKSTMPETATAPEPTTATQHHYVRLFEGPDYSMVREWWEGHGVEVIPAEMLPKLCALAVDPDDGRPTAFMALYMDNSVGVCFPNWLVTRPGLTPKQARGSFRAVDQFLRAQAARLGYGIALATTHHPVLHAEAEAAGYTFCGEAVTLFATTETATMEVEQCQG